MSSNLAGTFQFQCPDGALLRGVLSDPHGGGPIGVFLHGFRSDVRGRKAQAVWDHARARGYPWLSLDLRGHGLSDGRIADLRISVLRQDVEAVLAGFRPRPVLLVGSSLGGWLAGLVAQSCPTQVGGLVLIAPAFNFIQQSFAGLPPTELKRWEQEGTRRFADPYSEESYTLDYALLADAHAQALRPPLTLACPVGVVHGTRDEVVPPSQSARFIEGLSAPVKDLVWVPDGDHRLHSGVGPVLELIDRYWQRLA